jgi:hypothetical protein
MRGMREEEGGRRKEEGGRRKEEGGRRKEEGGRRKEEGGRRREAGNLLGMLQQQETGIDQLHEVRGGHVHSKFVQNKSQTPKGGGGKVRFKGKTGGHDVHQNF